MFKWLEPKIHLIKILIKIGVGGMVDDRYKPVITKPYILTVGQDPFIQYNEKSSTRLAFTFLFLPIFHFTFTSMGEGNCGEIWNNG